MTAVWVMWWSEANAEKLNKNVGMYIGVYAMLGVLGTVGVSGAAW